jgi:septation ring formation regulator EzrA
MTQNEKNKIKAIMQEYSSCYNEIELLEKEIERLLDNKNKLVERLYSIRDDEMVVVSELKQKYGEEASLDLEKLEIIR